MSDEDRELPATPRRREEAAAAGFVARSSELTAAGLFLAGITLAWLAGPWAAEQLALSMRQALTAPVTEVADLPSAIQQQLAVVGAWAFAAIALCGLAAVGIELLQVGWRPNAARLAWNLDRLSPWNGLSRLVDGGQLLRSLAAMMKLTVLAALAWQAFTSATPGWHSLATAPAEDVARVLAGFCFKLAWTLGLAAVGFGAIDYLLAWRRLEQDLQMSSDEVRADAERGNRRRRGRRAAPRETAPASLTAAPPV